MSRIRYGSVCSGIEAASVAWEPLGWRPAWFAEIDKFPSAVLAHHYPEVPNLGDFTKIQDSDGAIDLLAGGTPCQSFSVAGLRKGLDDDRGNLALEFLRLAGRTSPRWVVWENVPGVLSSNGGRDFGAFLGGLAELGYGFAYRVLDAQYVRVDGFGRAVPQRRRRVFVVGYLGDWRRAASVLFDRESLSGNPPPGRSPGQGVAGTAANCLRARSNLAHRGDSDNIVAHCLTAKGWGRIDGESETFVPTVIPIVCGHETGKGWWNQDDVAGTLRAEGENRPSRPSNIIAKSVAFQERGRDGGRSVDCQEDVAYSLNAPSGGGRRQEMNVAIGFHATQDPIFGDVSPCLPTDAGAIGVFWRWAVRRLTPRECERLQGFPDDYTLVDYRGKPAKDGPRYKATGNSMAVNVMRWIGTRIQMVEDLC